MKQTLYIAFILCSFAGFSQRKFMFGVVKDSVTKEEIIGTHIRNLTSDKLTIADEYGKFRMPVQVGDTILLTNVGYQMLGWVAEAAWFEQDRVEFMLPVDTIYLEEVVIGDFPEYERFKQIIVDTQAKDTSFWYHGVPQVEMEEHTVLEKKQYLNPLFIATHPISFLHHAVSKKEKEKRKMQQIMKRSGTVSSANQKFTREWVGEMTKLEGEKLTSFISYCNFTPEYLAKNLQYTIHERMMALLKDFLEEESEG